MSKLDVCCRGATVSTKTVQFYQREGVSMMDWSICEWCAENGCADPEWKLSRIQNYEYPNSSELPTIQEDQRLILTYQCDCDKPHAQLEPKPCEICLRLAVISMQDYVDGEPTPLGECCDCIDCGIGIDDFERSLNFKYCWACARKKTCMWLRKSRQPINNIFLEKMNIPVLSQYRMDDLRKAHAIILTMQRISGYKLTISPFYGDMYKLVINVGGMQVASIRIESTVVYTYTEYDGRDESWSDHLNSLFTQHGIPNNTWVDIACNKSRNIAMYAREGTYQLVANTHMSLHITEDEFYTIAEVALRKYHP